MGLYENKGKKTGQQVQSLHSFFHSNCPFSFLGSQPQNGPEWFVITYLPIVLFTIFTTGSTGPLSIKDTTGVAYLDFFNSIKIATCGQRLMMGTQSSVKFKHGSAFCMVDIYSLR